MPSQVVTALRRCYVWSANVLIVQPHTMLPARPATGTVRQLTAQPLVNAAQTTSDQHACPKQAPVQLRLLSNKKTISSQHQPACPTKPTTPAPRSIAKKPSSCACGPKEHSLFRGFGCAWGGCVRGCGRLVGVRPCRWGSVPGCRRGLVVVSGHGCHHACTTQQAQCVSR